MRLENISIKSSKTCRILLWLEIGFFYPLILQNCIKNGSMIVAILDYFKCLTKKNSLLRPGTKLKKRLFFSFYHTYLVIYNKAKNHYK